MSVNAMTDRALATATAPYTAGKLDPVSAIGIFGTTCALLGIAVAFGAFPIIAWGIITLVGILGIGLACIFWPSSG